MIRIPGIAAACLMVAVSTLPAQTPASADSIGAHEVGALSIKSGKLALSSAANPGPVFLPDGVYTNESNTVIVVLDGRITGVEYESGKHVRVASLHMQRDRVMLTPTVTALMSVSPFPLPSGKFTSQDGVTLTVVSGRPTEFTLRAAAPQH
jgi:hypothetical protein